MSVFRFFENLLRPTELPPEAPPPKGVAAFYWHHVRQIKTLLIALFIVGSVTAVLDASIPVFIGRVVSILTALKPEIGLADAWPQLVAMARRAISSAFMPSSPISARAAASA